MPTIDQRLVSVEAKVDGISELRNDMRELRTEVRADISEFRAEMREFREEMRTDMREFRTEMREFRAEMNLRFDQADRRVGAIDQKVDRHFMWLVTGQAAMVAAFVGWLVMVGSR